MAVCVVAEIACGLVSLRCGPNSIAPQACRSIEQARCRRAAELCPELGITAARVELCVEAARDRCLHGLAVSPEPAAVVVQACVRAIEQTTLCSVVAAPETTVECGFLVPHASSDAGASAVPDAGSSAPTSVDAGSNDAASPQAGP